MYSYREIMDSQKKYMETRRSGEEMSNQINPVLINDTSCTDQTVQTHTHEFESSTKLAEEGDDRHNHRFAGVTSEVIPLNNKKCDDQDGKRYKNHKHAIFTLTDFFGHLHEVAVETGPAIDVGNGKHVHFIKGNTTIDDGHYHEFAFATLIEAPLLPPEND